jgi:hypothetical protein
MNATRLEQLETEINALPLSDQLWLMERMARQIRGKAINGGIERESQIAAMAADPQIQQELREIEAEFAGTEGDGLHKQP